MSDLPILAEPREGVPPVVNTPDSLTHTCRALSNGHGPIAIDTEPVSYTHLTLPTSDLV